MLRFMVFDHLDRPVGELSEREVLACELREEVNGEHALEIETTQVLAKGQRIVFKDARGIWREHVVDGVDDDHAAGRTVVGTYYCPWSVQADLAGVTVSAMPGVQSPVSAQVALAAALSTQTRWGVGDAHLGTGGASMYDMSAWKALGVLVENWGGELGVTIGVSSAGVVSREVDLPRQLGAQSPTRRYDFGADLVSVKRKMPDGPLYCRISPRGKGEQSDGGGYGRKITIESVNGGLDYLEYAPMVEAAKIPDGSGYIYPTLIVENSSCETPADLKAWGQSVLEESCTPKVRYEVDCIQAACEGVDVHGVSLGDVVHVVDRYFGDDGVRVEGRVMSVAEDVLGGRETKVRIGDLGEDFAARLAAIGGAAQAAFGRVDALTTALATSEYVASLLDRINAEINANGGYTYILNDSGGGIRTYDDVVSDPETGLDADEVVEIKGGSIRIANSKTNGAWDWKTVFTSGHILADLVTAAKIVAGFIGSAGDTFIDLDNHTVQLGRSNSMHTVVDSAGTKIYSGSDLLGFFGLESGSIIVRVGRSTAGNVVMSSDGSVDVKRGSTVLAHFGYGDGVNSSGGTTAAPYYTIGTRAANSTIGNYSVAEGSGTTASGYVSHAEGNATVAKGSDSHAEGYNTKALTTGSHAEGGSTTAGSSASGSTAFYAHAEGENTTASGRGSHAEGGSTTASKSAAHAEGSGTTASGLYSHAEGANTTASGDYSHASGRNTTAGHSYQFVCGRWNSNNSSDLFEVGNGWGGTDGQSPNSNAFRIDAYGATYATSFNQSSDERVKTDVSDLDAAKAIDLVKSLRPRRFKKFGKDQLGFIAQEVEVLSYGDLLVDEEENYGYDDFRTLDYEGVIAPLVTYCQHLEKRIERLEARLDSVTGGGQ